MLQRFESRLEQAVSGAFAKAFRSAVQPVELAAALQREVDNNAQILSRNRRLVPNVFTIELSPTDHERLAPYEQTLTDELVEMLREHAHEQRYVFAGPVSLGFTEADDLVTGRFRVKGRAAAQVQSRGGGKRPERATTVALEVHGDRHPLSPPGAVLGRGSEADLRINDPGISRRHAEIRVSARKGEDAVSVIDLHSTNGTVVDGRKIAAETPVHDGSLIRIGNTDLTVRVEDEGR